MAVKSNGNLRTFYVDIHILSPTPGRSLHAATTPSVLLVIAITLIVAVAVEYFGVWFGP